MGVLLALGLEGVCVRRGACTLVSCRRRGSWGSASFSCLYKTKKKEAKQKHKKQSRVGWEWDSSFFRSETKATHNLSFLYLFP